MPSKFVNMSHSILKIIDGEAHVPSMKFFSDSKDDEKASISKGLSDNAKIFTNPDDTNVETFS